MSDLLLDECAIGDHYLREKLHATEILAKLASESQPESPANVDMVALVRNKLMAVW
jgi:hypothetical protein